MKFFIDTANIDEIKEAQEMGILDGVTTNPSLAAKENRPYREILTEICRVVDGPVSAEVIATDSAGMIAEADELVKIGDNIVVKIPTILSGLTAIKTLSERGIKTNATLVFPRCRRCWLLKLVRLLCHRLSDGSMIMHTMVWILSLIL